METQMSSNPAPPLVTPDAHAAFIQTQLPTWLTDSPADTRAALRANLLKSNQSRHKIQELIRQLQSPEAFAFPLFEQALRREYLTLLNAKTSVLVREWKNHHLFGLLRTHARTTEQSLLEAALQNFEASEAEDGGMETGTELFNITQDSRFPSLISATLFAGFCRKLDLGGQYLKHIRTVISTNLSVRRFFREHEQQRFNVALHLAYLKKKMPETLYEELVELSERGHHVSFDCFHLTLGGVVLPDVLVIVDVRAETGPLLYTPEDPIEALRQHPSMDDLETQLVKRLMRPDYLAFFKRLAPVHQRESLLHVKPMWIDWLPIGSPGKIKPAQLDKPLTLTKITGNLFHAIILRRFSQIESDACEVAVPTAQVDAISRQKRLQFYADLGKSLLFFAASFVPIVGEVLLVVTAAQLIGTVYNGFAAWSRGDSQQALDDLLDVVDNVAMAVATAGVIKAGRFTAGLVKVQVRNQGWRLWHSDLEPYQHPATLPEHVVADKQGIYQYQQQSYLKLDDHPHAIQRSPDGTRWELSHPSDPHAYSPPLLNNEAGGWRHVHETPEDWDTLKLIKRLGPDAANITQPSVEPILLISGLDSTTLRQAHQEMVRPAPLLCDTVTHFNLDQEINDFNLSRAEGTSVTAHSPLIQAHLLTSLPEWPATYGLKVVDQQQQTVMQFGQGNVEIKVSEDRFRKGELLHAIEAQMPQTAFNNLLPSSPIDYFSKTENLALRLSKQAAQKKQWLFSQLNAANEAAVTPTEKSLRTLMPQLSKRHLEEIERTLPASKRQRLQAGDSLDPVSLEEADHYTKMAKVAQLQESIFLNTLRNRESVQLMLYTLEQIPGWPGSRRIDVYDDSTEGPLLGSIGNADAPSSHTLIRKGELYALHASPDTLPPPLTDLPHAIEQTLSPLEHRALLRQSGADSFEQALHKSGKSLMASSLPRLRGKPLTLETRPSAGLPLDPLFAEPTPPAELTRLADQTFQAPPLPDGSFRYYVQDEQNYYQIKKDPQGWRLVDARSRFRAYSPYLRKNANGGWEIDPAKGGLPGGGGSPAPSLESVDSIDGYGSAHSSNSYGSAEEGTVDALYTPQELAYMRTERSYQHSQNYRRIYDRANCGRYPLRDENGQPMRIRLMQVQGKSLTSGTVFSKDQLLPYIRWEGYENVARLYEDKLEVLPFTAAHQKFPQEAAMIGEATVITRRPLSKGEALGVYGGDILPFFVAKARRDPYLMAVKDVRPVSPHALNTQPVLSGDNALSRINTIFEYEADVPVRQAASGYNVEAAQFRVQAQVGNRQDQMILTGLFASESIPAGTELRWNYQYDEATIRALFARP